MHVAWGLELAYVLYMAQGQSGVYAAYGTCARPALCTGSSPVWIGPTDWPSVLDPACGPVQHRHHMKYEPQNGPVCCVANGAGGSMYYTQHVGLFWGMHCMLYLCQTGPAGWIQGWSGSD